MSQNSTVGEASWSDHQILLGNIWTFKKKNIKTSASVKPSGCQILEDFVALLSLLFCTYAPNYCPSFREHDENRPRWKSWSRGSAECNAMPRISHSFHFEKSMAADSLLWYMWGSPDFLASSNDPWNFSWLKISRRSHGQIPKGKDTWAMSAMSRSEPYSWNQYGLDIKFHRMVVHSSLVWVDAFCSHSLPVWVCACSASRWGPRETEKTRIPIPGTQQ